MTEYQIKLCKMLQWFHKYCEDNNLLYYAIGGTVLGAARHKGFIPWDDDIDIALPRDDYEKLIMLSKKNTGKYRLESPYSGNEDYIYAYAKLYDTSTTLIEKSKKTCKRGIYIDIFPLDGIGNNYNQAKCNFRRYDRNNMLLMMRTCSVRKSRSWYKNISIIMARIIPSFLINEKKLVLKMDKIAKSISSDNALYVANLNGTYREKEIIEKRIFGKPRLYDFEDFKIYGPEFYDEYLSLIYGDWRKLPPEEKRKSLHDYVELNLTKSYLDE